MIVERIRNLDITKRPILTGIYGYTFDQEYFIEDNLCKYNLWQELYRYLRGEGYTTVFYNEHNYFFSYEESQLETLFFKNPEEISREKDFNTTPNFNGQYISQFASPNGHNRRKEIYMTCKDGDVPDSTPTGTKLVSHNYGIMVKDTDVDHFFQLQSNEQVMDRIFGFMNNNPGHKLAVVFTMPSGISFGQPIEPRILSELQERFNKQRHAGTSLRMIVLFNYKEATQLYEEFQKNSTFYHDTWIKNLLFPKHQHGRSNMHRPSSSLFYVGKMGKDEVANMLMRRRITEGLRYTMSPIPFDDLCTRICQQFIVQDSKTKEKRNIETVYEFMELTIPVIERTILRMDKENAINKLKKSLGREISIEQFQDYVKAYHRLQENEDTASGLIEECPMLEFMTSEQRDAYEKMSNTDKDFYAMYLNRFPEFEINANPACIANILWWKVTDWYDADVMTDMFLALRNNEIAQDVADLILLEWESAYKQILMEESESLATWEGRNWTPETLRSFLERLLEVKKLKGDLKTKQKEMTKKYGEIQSQPDTNTQPPKNNNLRNALDMLVPLMKYNRQWFCVVKVLMWRGYVSAGDFSGAKRFISNLYPEGLPLNPKGLPFKIDPADLSKLDVLSFRKPLDKWDIADSPIKKKSDFDKYVSITNTALDLILKKEL